MPSAEEVHRLLTAEASNCITIADSRLQRVVLHMMHGCIGKQRWPMWGHAVDRVNASDDCAIHHGPILGIRHGLD